MCFFFFYCYGDHRDLHSFLTRRSSDLPEAWPPAFKASPVSRSASGVMQIPLMQPLQLRIQLFQATAVIRHVVSAGTAFLPAKLGGHDAADLFGVVAIAGAGAL